MKVTQRLFRSQDITNIHAIDAITEDIIQEVQESPHTWTVCSGDLPVCIWGKVPVWQGRCILWALMGEGSRSCMRSLIQFGKETISSMPEIRIEATVKKGFHSGIRFLELLGFYREGLMHKFSAEGHDEYLYARILL